MEKEIDYIEELIKADGVKRRAALKIGIPEATFRYRLKKQQHVRAFNDLGLKISDSSQILHPDLALSGISQMVKTPDGPMWVKSNKEQQAQINQFDRIGESVLKDIKPRPKVKRVSKTIAGDIMSVYALSDYHLGMFTDHDKDGEWNTEIARSTLYRWLDHAIDNSIDSHTGVFLQLGDFFHANDQKGTTPRSGHVLDIDTSWDDVIDIATEAFEYAIDRMLKKHEHVHFMNCEANHDPDAAKWIQRWFERLYRENPRVTVDCTKGGFYAYQWGKTGLFAHHGHSRNITQVSKVLTGMYPKIFGDTVHRYAHIGHFHHAKRYPVGDDGLMDCQIHQTLAAKDQYAVDGGWLSARGAKTMFYHKEYGYMGEFNVTPSMLF